MNRRDILALALFAAIAGPAASQEAGAEPMTIQVSAAQIETLLRGNTIKGTWNGSNYTQYYGESGFTVYLPEGGRPSRGKWRVLTETDQYGSWWENTGWTPYTIVMTNDGFAWVHGDDLEPFIVLKGKQVNF